ncbi:MAG: hypothetical protein HY912_23245 [Desulfomonile tiedjei]|uniref:GAF domain-containing protein n=1 Tax=Desulfomonile tiedjei TaxID=2358 RepID=A0A9D6Z8T0_9BACT|nr:hypothetical protein [Desulfomonile tiedjei]
MATLGERIFNEGVDGNYWPLQVVQHCLATLSNLPLRIWARGRAEGSNENPLDHSIEEGLISHVNSRSFFEELLTGHLELVSRYMQRQHSGWLTVSCQAHPLWAYLRRNHLWLVREHCLLWNELGKRDPSDEKAISCFRTRLVGQGEEDRHIELMMSAAPLSDKFKPLFLVVGPLVVLPEEGASERSFRGAIENLVEEIFQVIPPTLQDNHDYSSVGSCVTKELLKPRFDRLVMAQYGCTSGWITETRLVSQARHIAKVLDAILKTDCTLLENCKGLVTSKDFISSSAFNALTQVVFSLFPQELLDSNPNARIEKFRDDLVHYFKIGIPSDGPSLPARNQVLKAERTKNKWSLTIVRDVDKNRPKAWVERKDKAPLKKGDAEYEQRLGFLRNDIGLLAANSNREHMGRRLSEFSDWIRRTYGIVSAGLGGSAGVGLALGDLLNRLKLPQLPLTERLGRAELRQELLLGGVRDARNACSAIVKLERIASQSLTEARKYLEDVLANASSASWPGISVKLNHSRSRRIWEKTLTVLEQLHTHSLEASESLPKFLDEIKDSQSEVVAFIKESDLQCRRERPDNLSCGDESQECYVFQGLHGRATQYQNQLVTLKKVVTEYQKFQSSLRGLIREISSKIKDEMGPSLLGKEVSDASGKNVDIRKDCVQNSVSGVTKVLSQMAELHEQHSKYLDQLLESEYAISTDRSYKPIAREICNLFNADAVVFYLRDFSGLEDHEPRSSDRFEKRLLTPRTMWFDDLRRSMPTGGGPEARSRKVRMTRRAMWNVGKIGNKKEISIAYRAAEERRGQICLAWLKNRKGRDVFDPEKPKILTHEQMLELANSGTLTDGDKAGVEDVLTGKTVIAVPLMVYDRVMGVLEIIGHYPYQFRRDTLLFAEQVGQMTSQFLYQREMLGRLLRITRVVCDPRKNEDQKFKEICRDMADILLADGAILFVPSLQTPGLFKRAASFNFKNMDDADDQREQPVDFDEEIEKSAEHRVFTEYSIKERREKWMKSPLKHRKEIAKQFPNGYAMVIHVWDPTRMVVQCRLSVY